MKKSMSTGIIGMVFLFTILLTSCSPRTSIVSSWTKPEQPSVQSQKVLVIGLMGSKDRPLQEEVENSMVKALNAHGINAGSAYAEYGPKAFEGLNEKDALKKIQDKGYDGTFTIALLDRRKERRYTPPSIGFAPYPYYGFWGYYRHMYGRIYEPGYYTLSTNFILEANFYGLGADQLLYSAQTKTSAPDSPQILATEFTNVLIQDMLSKGLLKK
ncbi:hypothetical protein [Pedobacter caeni]|uniref:DUF4136 domain-containing protein n=1 Tax=Pedobacter caeni TaxID=288992 RepID=A0A1M5L079_9SPHI|nr:hypothetical protein [Pedobacter caeni]SHG58365.1 hypothetical protein SAMN04488522_106158 [Pedobacter caeni]